MDTDLDEIQRQIARTTAFLSPLREEIGRVLVGQEELVAGLLTGMLANGHVLVEGVPGLAKTLAVKALARAAGGTFSRVQFTPDLLPADLTGSLMLDPSDGSLTVRRGPVFANVFMADEINRAPAKVQSALLEAMQEEQVTIGGERHPLPAPFLVIATQNPIEQTGTYPLPEAQLDRFMLKLVVGYPPRKDEEEMVRRMAHPHQPPRTHPVASPEALLQARECLDRIYVAPRIVAYGLDLVIATRPGREDDLSPAQADLDLETLAGLVEFGASPRASLYLILAAKARALLNDRAYVTAQDVKDVAPAVLSHRIVPTYEAEAEGVTTTEILSRLLASVHAP